MGRSNYVDGPYPLGSPIAASASAILSDHDYMLGKTRTPIAPYGPQAFYGARPSNNNRSNNNNNRGNCNNSRDTRANSHVTPVLEAMDNSEAYYGDDILHVGNDESTHTTLLTGPSKYGLNTITLPQLKYINKVSFSAVRASPTIWHRRRGHTHQRLLHSMLSNFSFPVTNKSLSSFCNSCPLGNSSKLPSFESGFRSKNILDLVNCNVWGPAPLLSFEGHRYFMLCVDHHSCYMWIYHLAQKSNVCSIFKSFVQMVERQFTTKLKNVQTDWDGEFRNLALFFSSLGIIHRRSCPHTSEQNCFVERRNRHVVETGLTLLAQACVPQRFWHYAFDTVVYLINRMPSRTSTNKSPFELIFKRSLEYSFLCVFGCLCFPHLRSYNRRKMDFRSTTWVFLGYSPSHHGYHCLDISTERLYIARHVHFNESQFPSDIPKTTSPPPSKTSPYYSSESPYVIPTTDHPRLSSPRSSISSPSSVSHLSPTSQTSPREQVMKQPSGFIDPQRPNHVCLLHKSLYDLKQTPRAWFEHLFKALFDFGFKGSKTDPSLFIYARRDTLLYILVYVDDIIVTVKRILCYLHDTVEHGMLKRRSSGSTLQGFTGVLWKSNLDTSLEAFSDADWAGDSDDRRSTGDFLYILV
nr:retrovirus-related Pol polyprotein from transposon TNT 1-94 [Tanacetum cinerariifolium]